MSSSSNRFYSDRIVSLEPHEKDSYRVVIDVGDGKTIETVCRVHQTFPELGKAGRTCTFDSREFGLEFMAGNINSRAICRKIVEFHNKLNPIMYGGIRKSGEKNPE
ncbi:hypothetical protein [Acidicapsa acidisoli]|uniref:hypothetical protein n=1 Tax=Acidicapsa acidisoli TaxID=1615681 RepID=UPI0021E07B77|nr:hypothetical protein [Acidicapsa acidisoli]